MLDSLIEKNTRNCNVLCTICIMSYVSARAPPATSRPADGTTAGHLLSALRHLPLIAEQHVFFLFIPTSTENEYNIFRATEPNHNCHKKIVTLKSSSISPLTEIIFSNNLYIYIFVGTLFAKFFICYYRAEKNSM